MSGAAGIALTIMRSIPGVAAALLALELIAGKPRGAGGVVDPGIPFLHPQPRDPLSDIDLTEGDKGPSPREKRLREIARLLSIGRGEAERYLTVLEGLEDAKKRSSLLEDLSKGGIVPGASTSPVQIRGTPPNPTITGPADFDQEKHKRDILAILEAAPKVSAALLEVGTSWRNTVDQMLSLNGILEDGLGSLYAGISQGVGTVFANLTNRAQTFRSALKTIFSSLVQEILAMLGRIATAKIFQLLLNLIPGLGPVAGAVAGASKVAEGLAIPKGAGVQFNVNVNALNARDVVLSLQSPRGELRRAFEDAALSVGY